MADPRNMAIASPASGTEPSLLVELRAKYLDLSRKYAALVRRLGARTSDLLKQRAGRSSAYRLGFWALHATGGGLALVTDGAITARNARWHELDAGHGGWTREGDEPPDTYLHLSQIAVLEAAHLPEGLQAVAVRRYQSVEGDRVVELRLERVDSPAAPVVVLAQDVTGHVRAEQELSHMREALFQSEHLGILGELASSIAHELGNTLRGVTTRAAVLSQDPAVMGTHAPLLAGLQESAEAALDSVRKLHDLARSGRLQPGPVDLANVLQHAVQVLHLRQPPGAAPVQVDVELPDLPPVLGTTSEISHLFVTLLFNARDAMAKGGKIDVRAERARDQVRVSVADQGTGIAPEHMPHLFQPFFTTKGSGGTGLGLWLAHSTMRRLGGSISARNRAAGGAEFLVEFLLGADGQALPQGRAPARRRERTARRG
jgi:signal transduction histidine kinase